MCNFYQCSIVFDLLYLSRESSSESVKHVLVQTYQISDDIFGQIAQKMNLFRARLYYALFLAPLCLKKHFARRRVQMNHLGWVNPQLIRIHYFLPLII